jgi:NAD(P)-dependent dehydrogenase (short-subunit alcohol dehydrogenase family)
MNGVESHLMINYLGPYYLTTTLIKQQKLDLKTEKSAVVFVASNSHYYTSNLSCYLIISDNVTFSDFEGSNYPYSAVRYYGKSKFATILLTKIMHSLHQNINWFSIHPGYGTFLIKY